MNEAIKSYLTEIRKFRSKRTIAACEHILNLFGAKCSKSILQDIDRTDLLDHMCVLKESGLGQRTIYNHVARIITLLRSHKITGLLAGVQPGVCIAEARPRMTPAGANLQAEPCSWPLA